MFTLFVSRSIFALSHRSVFHLYHHLHDDQSYNLTNTDIDLLLLIIQSESYNFWMIMWMKNVNNFQIAKVQPQRVAQHLLIFFANLTLLIKVLVITKACSTYSKEKNNRKYLKNYRPVSLLPICGKILNEVFMVFIKNGQISQNQSGFKPGDSCVNQFLSISHEIYKSFGDGFDVRRV